MAPNPFVPDQFAFLQLKSKTMHPLAPYPLLVMAFDLLYVFGPATDIVLDTSFQVRIFVGIFPS